MADPYELMELEGYNRGPSPGIKHQKLKMEEELLIKLGAKKESIELHPLILSTRLERAKTFVDLQYSRATPPATERSYISRNPWHATDQALRQMSNPPRRGPRDFVLPNLVKSSNLKLEHIPAADFGFHDRREVIMDRLNKLLEEWAVYERRAFPPLIQRLSTLKDLVPVKPVRELTKANLETLSQSQGQRRGSSKDKSYYSWSTSSNRSSDGRRRTRRTVNRKKTRWSRMTQEVLLQMKASHVRLPAVLPRSELRVYVSSTPDLHEEREFLEEVAYPKLKELCEKIGLNCHFVDMRKGAGVLSNDIQTFDVIDNELKNCRRLSIGPYFVSLLGHQLDDQKLPGFLEKSVYEKIRETLVKEKIIGVEMFDEAYRLDSNRVPAVYIKQPLPALDEYQGPEHVEQILLTALNSALDHMKVKGQETQDLQDFYKWSAVVREVEGGILKSHNPRRETLCFMFEQEKRSPAQKEEEKGDEEEADSTSPVERLRQNVMSHCHRMASKSCIMKFKAGKKTISYLRSLSDTFIASMASLLKAQVRHDEYDVIQQMTEGAEALQHVRLAKSETDIVADNSKLLEQVHESLNPEDEDPKTILLVGGSGSGKTTLASQIAHNALMWDPRRKIVFRCLGLTLRTSSLYRTLEGLVKQLNFLYALDNPFPSDQSVTSAIAVFCDTLKLVSEHRKGRGNLLIILDNFEIFEDLDTHILLQFINSIRDGVTLVLSFHIDSPYTNVLKSHPTVQLVTLMPFNKIDIREFLKKKLTSSNRRVTQDQLSTVLRSLPGDSHPVYLEMVFNIIRWWPSHTLPEMERFSGDPEADFHQFLHVLETDVGKSFTKYALSLLVASRYGLADNELVHLLAEDGELLDEIKAEQDESVSVVEGFSCQLQLSRLLCLLGKFVAEIKIEGETIFQITCKALKRCIHDKYLKKDFFHAIHKRLATFFLFIRRGMLLSSKDISEKRFQELSRYQWRMMRCVPYHLCFSSPDVDEVWAVLKEKVFFNFSWLVNMIYSGFYIDLLDDIRFALENVDLDPDIQYLQAFLVSISHTAIHNPLSLASVFACQNIQESDDEIKDSVRDVIREARTWLTQVHTQALVPVEYTMDKINRLLIKKNTLRAVTNMWEDIWSANFISQRDNSLFLVNMVTREETKLLTLVNTITSIQLGENRDVFIATTDHEDNIQINVLSTSKGNTVQSMALDRQNVKWFDFRSTTEAYCCDDEGIQLINFEERKVKTIWAQKNPWLMSLVTQGNLVRIVTLTADEKLKVQVLTLKTTGLKMITFKNTTLNPNCYPILSTKDGKFLVIVFEREAVVIDLIKSEETEEFSHNGLPIIGAELSRSHEHIFLAYMNGSVSCHVLYSGNTSLVTQISPQKHTAKGNLNTKSDRSDSRNRMSPALSRSLTSPSRRHHRSSSSRKGGGEVAPIPDDVEIITTMMTSEDDHFLFCGTNHGIVYVIHVPTGHQLVSILTQLNCPVKKILYLTNKEHFQHLVTLNADGLALHWNMRPLMRQARALIKPYIIDNDLLKEERPKMMLREYYRSYQAQWSDRVFLNGPDIAAFYKDPPSDVFVSLEKLDPAFKPVADWESSGSIADVGESLSVAACGKQLRDCLMTVSHDRRVAKWSLYDGRLVWTKKLPFAHGNVHKASLVYYDQAVLVTETLAGGMDDRLVISVVYLGDGTTKTMTRHDVIGYWTSQDRCQVMILCQAPHGDQDLSFYYWDLINASEQERSYSEIVTTTDTSVRREDSLLFTTISPALTQVVRLSLIDESSRKSKNDNDNNMDTDIKAKDSREEGEEGEQEHEQLVGVDASSSRPLALPDDAMFLQRHPGTFPAMSVKRDVRFRSMIKESSDVTADDVIIRPGQNSPLISGEDKGTNEAATKSIKQVTFQQNLADEKVTKIENDRNSESEFESNKTVNQNTANNNNIDIKIMLSWNLLDTSQNATNFEDTRASASPKSAPPTSPSVHFDDEAATALEPEDDVTGTNDNNEPEIEGKQSEQEGNFAKTVPSINVSDETTSSTEWKSSHSTTTGKLQKNWCFLKLDLSAICFSGEQNLLAGTMSGHVMLLNIPTFHIACVLTASDGPELMSVESLDRTLASVTSPHRGPIAFVGTSDDGETLVSADVRTVCLWAASNRALTVAIKFDAGQELTHLVLSKDASVVAIVTNQRIINVWSSAGGTPRELATYMTTFDIIDLGMSSDCHKIVVKGKGHHQGEGEGGGGETVLEIFEVKNIDDVLMHVHHSRKQSRDEERRSSVSVSSNQKRRASRQMSDRRRSSCGQGAGS